MTWLENPDVIDPLSGEKLHAGRCFSKNFLGIYQPANESLDGTWSMVHRAGDYYQARKEARTLRNTIIDERIVRDLIPKLKKAGANLEKSIIICDIEGNEFELFNKQVFGLFKKSILFSGPQLSKG